MTPERFWSVTTTLFAACVLAAALVLTFGGEPAGCDRWTPATASPATIYQPGETP